MAPSDALHTMQRVRERGHDTVARGGEITRTRARGSDERPRRQRGHSELAAKSERELVIQGGIRERAGDIVSGCESHGHRLHVQHAHVFRVRIPIAYGEIRHRPTEEQLDIFERCQTMTIEHRHQVGVDGPALQRVLHTT